MPVKINNAELTDIQPGTSYVPAPTVYCNECSSLTCGLRLGEESVDKYYKDYQSDEFLSMRIKFEPSFAQRLNNRSGPNVIRKRGESVTYMGLVEDVIQKAIGRLPDRILDIGGGTGSNTPFKDRLSKSIFDVDRSLGYLELPKQSWPLVSLMNILEHVMNPVDFLKKAAAHVMNPGGYLVVEVPWEPIMRRISEGESAWKTKFIWTEHVNFFSKEGLKKCLELSGLDLIGEGISVIDIETSSGPESQLQKSMIVVCTPHQVN
jgi:2-polyprenyl-3-methyl-5-hydroxy-6-metoxy-1,4-benzoquinol methylase